MHGGGLRAEGGGLLHARDTRVLLPRAGGAVAAAGGMLRLHGCEVLCGAREGLAALDGGATDAVACTVARCAMEGAAVRGVGARLDLEGCTLRENHSHGATVEDGVRAALRGCRLLLNRGDGCTVVGARAALRDTLLHSNQGHGLSVGPGADVEVWGTAALDDGPASENLGGAEGSVIRQNHGSGVLLAGAGAALTARDTLVVGNAQRGLTACHGAKVSSATVACYPRARSRSPRARELLLSTERPRVGGSG